MILDGTYTRWESFDRPEPKPKFPRADALAVARELVRELQPHCERLIVAGSLRRRKQLVGDVEILFIPRIVKIKSEEDFFQPKFAERSETDAAIESLLARGVLAKRLNIEGHPSWGQKNKLANHLASGIPVDLFATTEEAWFNYLVCRTGSAENNVRIASAARARGLEWHPYREGFTDGRGRWIRVSSEQEVFAAVGMPYREPWNR